MNHIFTENRIDYDGSQLRSHWIRENFNIEGDAIAAFIGGCNVKPEHMVDMEDLEANASIFSKEMLHFIVEHFDIGLTEITLRQRVLVCIIEEVLETMLDSKILTRSGDDLFDKKCKLTVSIATKSPVSGLIHVGINIQSDGTPVKTKGLKDYDIKPNIFAHSVLGKYAEEISSISKTISKVKWVY